jgi:hypothetical protein
LAAIVLTAKMVQYRNSWLQKITALEKSNVENAKQIEILETEVRRLGDEYARVMLGWDKQFPAPGVGAPPLQVAQQQNGGLAITGVGTNLGFAPVPGGALLPVAYVFKIVNNESHYMGSFQPPDAGSLREDVVGLQPTWKVRQGEPARWAADQGATWRVRTRIPAPFAATYTDFYRALNESDEEYAKVQADLQFQTNEVQVATEHLNYRLGELEGDNDHTGLINDVAAEEERRNEVLATLDDLRHELKQAHEDLERLLDENLNMVKDLAERTSVTTTSAATP